MYALACAYRIAKGVNKIYLEYYNPFCKFSSEFSKYSPFTNIFIISRYMVLLTQYYLMTKIPISSVVTILHHNWHQLASYYTQNFHTL